MRSTSKISNRDVIVLADDLLIYTHTISSRLNKNLAKVLKAEKNWDLKSMDKLISVCEEDYSFMAKQWPMVKEHTIINKGKLSVQIISPEYSKDVEKALKDASLPVQGKFPEFEFPPFKLVIDSDQQEARLSMGRKALKISSLQPKELAAQVQRHYQKVTSRKLDSRRFLQDLLPAYEIANRLTYQDENVLWGRAVSLNKIYELFTMRRASRQEYPKELFQFDIGRMKEQFGLVLDQYKFELGFSRDQSKAMIIVDSQGRTHHISSLTVYRGDNK